MPLLLDAVSSVSGKASLELFALANSVPAVELLGGAGGADGTGNADEHDDDDDDGTVAAAAAVLSNDEDILLCHLTSMG